MQPSARSPGKGLADVVVAATALSDVDGRAGRLIYRGYDIADLAGQASFEEVSYLLIRGALPTQTQLSGFAAELAAGQVLTPLVTATLPAIAASAAPMPALRSLVSLAGHAPQPAPTNEAAALVAAQPVLLAAYHAARRGVPLPASDPALGIAGNLLWQLTGELPDPIAIAALDQCLVLTADHILNAATLAARLVAATGGGVHAGVVAALAAAAGPPTGPLAGGASQAVLALLESLSPDQVDAEVRRRLEQGERLPGFGHRVYRVEDPRATRLRSLSEQLAERTGDASYHQLARALEHSVMEAAGLYANVDLYAATVYRSVGIPADLCTAVFSVSRMAGWTAHLLEQLADNRLIRPDSEYLGPDGQQWVPIEQR